MVDSGQNFCPASGSSQTLYINLPQFSDTGPTIPNTDLFMPGVRQVSSTGWWICSWWRSADHTCCLSHSFLTPGRPFLSLSHSHQASDRPAALVDESVGGSELLSQTPYTNNKPGTETMDCLVGVVVKASASRVEDPRFESRLRQDFFRVESYQWQKLALQWLPCHAPGVIGSVLGLVVPVSVYCDWVRKKVWSATSISVWQDVKSSEQIRPWDTLACCWDIKQPTNNGDHEARSSARWPQIWLRQDLNPRSPTLQATTEQPRWFTGVGGGVGGLWTQSHVYTCTLVNGGLDCVVLFRKHATRKAFRQQYNC